MKGSGEVIWIINQFAGTPESGWGERHYYLSQYWKRQGYDVKIISGSFNHVFNKFPETKGRYTIEEKDGITFCWVKSPTYRPLSLMRFWSMLIFAFRVYKLPVDQLRKPDILFVSSMPIFPIVPAHRLKRRYGAKMLLFEVRDLWPLTPRYLGGYRSWNPVIMMLKAFERFAYRHSDKVVTLMPDAGCYINAIAGTEDKVIHIPNGINQEVLETEEVDPEVLKPIPEGKFIVGYAGTLGIANAMEYFIDAAALLQDHPAIHFIIIGDGYLRDTLMEKAKGLSNVTFMEKVPRRMLQSVIRHFDIGFISSRNLSLYSYGGSANKFFDYMLAKKPILAAYVDNNDPIKLSGCGIRVSPEDPEAIKEGVLRFYHMTEAQRAAIAQKGYDHLMNKHDISILADQFAAVFRGEASPQVS